jgi:hypothetical protein
VQRSDDALPDEVLDQPKIVLRIGINLGDVIIEGDDVYGDGVNMPRGMLRARGDQCANQGAASCRRHNKVAGVFLSGPGFSLSSSFKFNG